MRTRTVQKRLDRRCARFARMTDRQKKAEAMRQLLGWRREAYRRAARLSAPEVWALARDPLRRAVVRALGPKGKLQLLADLEQICAEAVASQAGRFLVRGSRPLADRARLVRPG